MLKNTILPVIIATTLLSLTLPQISTAKGNPEAGATKSQTCHACHGKDGIGLLPEYPILAGQYSSYLVKALEDYKSGARKNAIMAGFATALSKQDMEDIAAYYAKQPNGVDVLTQ